MTETDGCRPYSDERSLSAVLPGLLLVAADAVTGWFLYGAVDPRAGIVLWLVALLIVVGLLGDSVGRISRSVASGTAEGLLCTPTRE